jgi:hypothetical protein
MDKEIKTEKRPWQKPELIVLVRSRPEEAVLANCKFDTTHGGPDVSFGACELNLTDCGLSCLISVGS